MLRICLSGATGGVGRWLARAILDADDMVLDAAVARTTVGQDIGTTVGRERAGLAITDDLVAALERGPDVMIDYTHPSVIHANTMKAVEMGVSVVVGTSGLGGAELRSIDAAARRTGIGVVTGNFALTAALMQHLARIACRHVAQWEILEYNKADKPDAPSGTATELAELLGAERHPEVAIAAAETYGHPEARGAGIEGTRVHAIRLPGVASACEVIFGQRGERLTIRHETLGDDSIFTEGTLLAARRIGSMTGLVRGLDSLLFSQ